MSHDLFSGDRNRIPALSSLTLGGILRKIRQSVGVFEFERANFMGDQLLFGTVI